MDRLTADKVYAAATPERGQTIIWDSEVAGFGLRVTAGGAKAFILNYRFADPGDRRKSSQYRFTIGPAKTAPRGAGWSVDEARREAGDWSKKIDRGESHPLAKRKGNRDALKAAREAETFQQAFAEYVEHEQKGRKGNATAVEVERSVLKHCTALLEHPVKDIAAKEIGKLLRELRDGRENKVEPRPYMANRLFSYLRTFFAWCARPDVAKITASPMIGMLRPWEGEAVRDRVFSDKELKAIWQAADEIGGTGGPFVKIAMLTGKRKGALSAMRWDELDGEGLWVPPEDPRRRRKRTKRLHGIPLPKLAQRILAPLKKDGAAFVFPGRGAAHLHPGSDLADAVKNKSGVADFFFHALRHTLETGLAELKVQPHVRDILMDHVPARGAGEGYDHWHYRDEMAEALELWAAHIEKVVLPKGARVLR